VNLVTPASTVREVTLGNACQSSKRRPTKSARIPDSIQIFPEPGWDTASLSVGDSAS